MEVWEKINYLLEEKNMSAVDLIGLAADRVKTYAEQENNMDYWREFTPKN